MKPTTTQSPVRAQTRPSSTLWALVLILAIAASSHGDEVSRPDDGRHRAFPRELALGPSGEPLTKEQIEAIESGDVLTHLAEEQGSAVKKATAVALIDAQPEAIFAVLLDFERFPAYMAYVEKIEVLGETAGATRVRFHLDLPWPVGNRDYVLLMTNERATEAGRAVLISRWQYESGSGNINETKGYWKVYAYDEGRSFVQYMVLTDPGGKVPPWMADKATAVAVPQVIKSVRKEVADAEQRAKKDAE